MKLARPLVAWAMCSLLTACAEEEGPPAPMPQSRLSSIAPAEPATAEAPAAPAPPATRRPQWPQARSAPAVPAAPSTEGSDQEEVEKPPRDLPGELLQQLGGAPACIQPRPGDEAPPSFRIAVTAVVGPTGRVTRSEATSGQLHTEELQCIRDQVEDVRFATPIEGAPTSVRATLELRLASSPASP